MHRDFLDYLADPLTKEPLELRVALERHGDVIEGSLRSPTAEYPITSGVPRFVSGSPAASRTFGYQWARWPRLQFESANLGRPMEGYTRRMWEHITGCEGEVSGDLVLDIGCGAGRFVEVSRAKGLRVIGIDQSLAVDTAVAQFRGDAGICVCQADALALPIRRASVDGAFSIGVLHHTPDPAAAVRQAAEAVRPGGWVAISVYSRGGYYGAPMVNRWRRAFQRLWPYAGHYPPLGYAYGAVYLSRLLSPVPLARRSIGAVFPSMSLPDVRWSVLDTFDSVTPQWQSVHDCHEVFGWMKNCGLAAIEPTPWSATSFRARKPRDGTHES
jgi:SAM-dependent methyltransferase